MKTHPSVFLANRTRFAARWPQQAAHLDQSLAKKIKEDPKEVSLWFKRLDLLNIRALIVYGVGMGAVYREAEAWLKEDNNRYLVFIEDHPDAFSAFLGTETATQALNNPQVVFFPFHIPENYDWSLVADDFKWLFTFIAVLSYRLTVHPENLHEDPDFCDRLISHLYTNLMHSNRQFREYFVNQKLKFRNFYHNLVLLPQASGLAHGLFDQFKNVPAIICGAGPSLEKQIPYIRELIKNERALVFASGSAMNALTQAGIVPHFGGAIDPYDTQESRQLTQWGFQVPFFYRNSYCYKALRLVHGPRLYITGSGGLDVAKWFEDRLGITSDEAIVPGMSTTNFCTEVAGALGCNPVVFVGTDLAYTKKERYAPGVEAHAAANQGDRDDIHKMSDNIVEVTDVWGEPITTKWSWLFEAMSLTSFARRYAHIDVWNATEGGMPVMEIPNKYFKEVVEQLRFSQGDLHTRIHEAILRSPIPANCSEKLPEAIEEWSQSLYRCHMVCMQLQLEIPEAAQKLVEGEKDSPRISELESQLRSEPAYLFLLKTLEEKYQETLFREKICWEWHFDAFPKETQVTKPLQWKWATMKYLSEAANYHLQELLDALKTTLSTPKKTENVPHASEVPLEGGLRHGEIALYHSNGQLFAKEHWVHGDLDGLQQYYYSDGTLHAQFHYRGGWIDGDVTLNFPNGQAQRILHLHRGKAHGVERLWNEAGQLIMECDYRAGKPAGKARWWHPNGRLAREVHYHPALNRIEVKEWDPEGKPLT